MLSKKRFLKAREKNELVLQLNDAKVALINIEEISKGYDHLDIELRIKEYGYDHWMLVYFKAEQPTDGFNFNLSVESPIQIKQFNVFDVGHNYHIDKTDKDLHIGCYQWINEGAGLSTVISFEESKIEEIYKEN